MEHTLPEDEYTFLVFNKVKSPGKYVPIYKSECKLPRVRVYSYSGTTLGTDTMFGGHDDQECLV